VNVGQKWIIDVLADLESFAFQNGFPLMTDRMREAAVVALAKIASISESLAGRVRIDAKQTEPLVAVARSHRPA
jgi:hypothetical protein